MHTADDCSTLCWPFGLAANFPTEEDHKRCGKELEDFTQCSCSQHYCACHCHGQENGSCGKLYRRPMGVRPAFNACYQGERRGK